MDKQKIDAAAKIIDPKAFARWESGDTFGHLQIDMRIKAAREKASQVASIFLKQPRLLDTAASLGALIMRVDQAIGDRSSDQF